MLLILRVLMPPTSIMVGHRDNDARTDIEGYMTMMISIRLNSPCHLLSVDTIMMLILHGN